MAKFQELSPVIDELDSDQLTIFFSEYYNRREADLAQDPAPVAKKKRTKAARSKATKKGKMISVTEDELRLLRKAGLI